MANSDHHANVAKNWSTETKVVRKNGHRGNRNDKTNMEFKVRWAGYDESEDSWEPWKELRNTIELHEYLRTHNMKSLITTK